MGRRGACEAGPRIAALEGADHAAVADPGGGVEDGAGEFREVRVGEAEFAKRIARARVETCGEQDQLRRNSSRAPSSLLRRHPAPSAGRWILLVTLRGDGQCRDQAALCAQVV